MTTLTVYRADGSGVQKAATTDITKIIRELDKIGILMERWPVLTLAKDADSKAVLDTYSAEIDRLNKANGFTAIDVLGLQPSAPNKAEMRAKFLSEHTHDDDEVRYFIEGSGSFYIRTDALVYQIVCTQGDLISVPRGTKHWFDTGPEPSFRVIRFFTNPNGWVGNFTGDDIATRIPLYEQKAA